MSARGICAHACDRRLLGRLRGDWLCAGAPHDVRSRRRIAFTFTSFHSSASNTGCLSNHAARFRAEVRSSPVQWGLDNLPWPCRGSSDGRVHGLTGLDQRAGSNGDDRFCHFHTTRRSVPFLSGCWGNIALLGQEHAPNDDRTLWASEPRRLGGRPGRKDKVSRRWRLVSITGPEQGLIHPNKRKSWVNHHMARSTVP